MLIGSPARVRPMIRLLTSASEEPAKTQKMPRPEIAASVSSGTTLVPDWIDAPSGSSRREAMSKE